jgi:hypothetical protein
MSEIKYAISQVFRGIRIAGCSFLLGSAFVVGCGILKGGALPYGDQKPEYGAGAGTGSH